MHKNECEIWDTVKALEGKTIETLVNKSPNCIEFIEDTGQDIDKVIIKDRKTKPVRKDVINAYKILISKGELDRAGDLIHLSDVNKKTSSIIFAVVFNIALNDVDLVKRGRRTIIVLKNRILV